MTSLPPVTFILFAYKQEAFVERAIMAALAQDYPNLQVILSDDCSPDGTFAIMKKAADAYRGPHDVLLNRMERNVGLSAHISSAVAKATGGLLIMAAGDDVAAPQRSRRLVETWLDAGGGPAVIYSDYRAIDLSGDIVPGGSPLTHGEAPTLHQVCRGEMDVHGATSAITADLFALFPTIAPDVVHEDRVLPFRALLLGGKIVYVNEMLVDYRIEGGVSRTPLDLAMVKQFTLKSEQRGLADACQRLADLRYHPIDDPDAESLCLATIAKHEAALRFLLSPVWKYEITLIKILMRSNAPRQAARMYLRHRLQSLGVAPWIRRMKCRDSIK